MKSKKMLYLTAVLCTAIVITLPAAALAQAPDDPAPPVVRTTWGAVKVLYRHEAGQSDSTSVFGVQRTSTGPMNAGDLKRGPFPCGEWYSRVLWEARYALSRRADGTSAVPIKDAYGNIKGYWGDWDYSAGDQYALGKAKEEAFGYVGSLGPANGHYRGGWCTFFARLVLYRATYWSGCWKDGAYWHLTMPNFPYGVYSWCNGCCMNQDYSSARPGWLLMSPGVPHVAIADSRGTFNGQVGWWVIDSNFVGGNGGYYIAKHFMSDASLRSSNYWVWNPTWATTN